MITIRNKIINNLIQLFQQEFNTELSTCIYESETTDFIVNFKNNMGITYSSSLNSFIVFQSLNSLDFNVLAFFTLKNLDKDDNLFLSEETKQKIIKNLTSF